MAIVGHMDAADARGIAGWVRDTDAPQNRLTLEWRGPFGTLESCVADRFRPDLALAGIADGAFGFEVRFDQPLKPEFAAQLRFKVVGTDHVFTHRIGKPSYREAPEDLYNRLASESRAAGRSWRKFKRCYLHIGTEKTGTTSLQAYLAENDAALARHGVAVSRALATAPDADIINNTRLPATAFSDPRVHDDMRASFGIVDAASLFRSREQTFREFLDEVRGRSEGADTLILSSEHCHSRLLSEQDVANLKAFLDPFCEAYTVVAYLRPQYELAVSQYGMAVANGAHDIEIFPPMPPPADYRHTVYTQFAYFDYQALLLRWAAVFGDAQLHPRVFKRAALKDGDVVADFLSLLPMPTPRVGRRRTLNTNLSPKGLAFLRALNEQFGGGGDAEGSQLIRDRMRNAAQAVFPGVGPQPSRREAEAFMARFETINDAVRVRWFPDKSRLFDLNFDKLPETSENITLGPAELMTAFVDVLKKDQEMGFSLTRGQARALATGKNG